MAQIHFYPRTAEQNEEDEHEEEEDDVMAGRGTRLPAESRRPNGKVITTRERLSAS